MSERGGQKCLKESSESTIALSSPTLLSSCDSPVGEGKGNDRVPGFRRVGGDRAAGEATLREAVRVEEASRPPGERARETKSAAEV